MNPFQISLFFFSPKYEFDAYEIGKTGKKKVVRIRSQKQMMQASCTTRLIRTRNQFDDTSSAPRSCNTILSFKFI